MNTPEFAPLSQFAAFIGLDWADGKHDLCLQVAGTTQREFRVIEHRPEVIDEPPVSG